MIMFTNPAETFEERASAVAKVVDARRARHRADSAHARLTAAAMTERVTGLTLDPPRPGRDGWWLVGRVVDELVDAEFSVWYMPGEQRGERRVSLSIRPSDPDGVQFTALHLGGRECRVAQGPSPSQLASVEFTPFGG
jgi:hypothetical protein